VFHKTIFTLFLLTLTTYGFTADESDSQTVQDKDNRYVIEFPKSWKISSGADLGVDIIATSPTPRKGVNFVENANIVSQILDTSISAQDYFQSGLPELKKFNGFKLGKILDITINDHRAVEAEYSYILHDQEIKVLQFIVVKDKLAVVLTFGSDPEDFPTIKPLYETIANTLVIKGN
jgi:hypothetical protein